MPYVGSATHAFDEVQNQLLRGLDGSTIDPPSQRAKQQIRSENRDYSKEGEGRITKARERDIGRDSAKRP